MRALLCLIGMSFLVELCLAQGSSFVTPSDIKLEDSFKDYFLTSIKESKKKNKYGDLILELQVSEKKTVNVILGEAPILSPEYKISSASNAGIIISQNDLITTYRGYVNGYVGSDVRLSVKDNFIYGYVNFDDKKYFVEPAVKFDNGQQEDIIIVYEEKDVIVDAPITCASKNAEIEASKIGDQNKSGNCQLVDLAIAIDYSYVQDYNGVNQAINQTMAIMNMVAGDYEDAFADDVRFEIVEHYVSDCGGCDPWSSTTDANALLTSFTNWGPTGFSQEHDLAQLWTNRNICGDGDCSVAGLAWIDAVCGSYRYNILEDFSSTAWMLRVLVSHETGHNFGSNHDSGNGHIMAPSISVNTSSWSANSIATINGAMTGYHCLDDCIIGSCTEILNISTSNCSPGSPSTYSLSLEIRHGGGGSAQSFNVNVNDQSFSFNWENSPQEVLITGLVADGTENNQVTIQANDNSDAGCSGSVTYDEPTSTCAATYVIDFNDCALPLGWNKATTNTYSWNGGDPLVQYEWKIDDATRAFNNYDNGSNAASLKTIDGTCMAIMDDDIFNHNLYTGIVTLTSDSYNFADFDTLMVSFEYNFHKFEAGKSPNNSVFTVEAYNGSNWVVVFTDNDYTCPWSNVWQTSCTDYQSLDLTAYKNTDFQIRYKYSDGNDGAWAGMLALDNIEIKASTEIVQATCNDGIMNGNETGVDCGGDCVPCNNDCLPYIVIEGEANSIGGSIEAQDSIKLLTNVDVMNGLVMGADAIIIESEMTVTQGDSLTIFNEGCEMNE